MRKLGLAVLALAACEPPSARPTTSGAQIARLLPPATIDPDARGAAYMTAVALRLQPSWGSFLDDCRLRLSETHALNDMGLAATAELAVDVHGTVTVAWLQSSMNADFDRAVREVVRDAAPLPTPPRELWSDDDRVHLRWLFARDRRQAGPATAEIIDVELPLAQAVDARLAQRDLTRAVRRIERAPLGPERDAVTRRVMVAGLREALDSVESSVRRAAIETIDKASVHELAPVVRDLFTTASDGELRLVALPFATTELLVASLQHDLEGDLSRTLAVTRALKARGESAQAEVAIRAVVEPHPRAPGAIALHAIGLVPVPTLAPRLADWLGSSDAAIRAGACAALATFDPGIAWPYLVRGMKDRDASVRAACVEVARLRTGPTPAALDQVRALARDRDRGVRSRALLALAALRADELATATSDPAAEVRAAYAAAIAIAHPGDASGRLVELTDDRDADVRAAAWLALAQLRAPLAADLVERGSTDPAAHVRRAVASAINDDVALRQLATSDVSPEVRTAAFARLAQVNTRAALDGFLLERFATGAPASAERVRTAMAWLVAP